MRHQNDPGTFDLMTGRLLLGYARVSTDEQDLTNQRADLHAGFKTVADAQRAQWHAVHALGRYPHQECEIPQRQASAGRRLYVLHLPQL
jgi:DNA invertase Pin-like site-specific DNA recombinase